ncbi:MAG: Helicase associated domain protein, partial [Magnetococcales bacterium]|nr:Helicase associated domain protein [Magnetococcales bacterium]
EGTIPLEARRRHGLPERITGADGIFRTLSGEIYPYQLLFRPDRPPLGRKEVLPFLELADRVPQPLLFTNCTSLPPPLRNHNGFHAILGNDLDRLTARSFNAIRRWLQGGGMVPDRLPPNPQQARYVATVQHALEKQDRLLAVVAPGIGAELLALKWAEGVGGGRTVLLVSPSLTHLRDTLLLWRQHAAWSDLATLWVGTDLLSGADAAALRQADFDLPLVGESEAVRRFLGWRFQGVRVVLTTYGSVRIVARAMVGFAPFDLGILLESQETLTDPFVLDDGNLPLRKRLFLSATTRHANSASRDAEGEPRPLWSLEDPLLYGPILPVAPLPQGMADGLLRPWQLRLVLVPAETTSRSEDEERLQLCAHALGMVLAQTHAHHIQIYHGTIQEARAFANANLTEWWQTLPTVAGKEAPQAEAFLTLCLEGTATAAEREALLHQFSLAPKALLHTARALSDGLSPPPADLICFAQGSKKVKWDLPRALGALLGKAAINPMENQLQGQICIPLRLPSGTEEEHNPTATLAAQCLATADTLWEVVQILRELDSTLEQQICQAGETFGMQGVWPGRHGVGSPLGERFQLVLPDSLPTAWADAIWHHFLDRLCSLWDQRFGQWQQANEEQDATITEWVEQQRRAYRKESLRPDRVWRLEQLGFVWDLKKAAWDAQFATLQRYHQQYGHVQVPPRWPVDPVLADWVQLQRREYLRGRLEADAQARLESIGFVWDPEQAAWDEMFGHFQAFQEQQGHGVVPEHWPSQPALAEWAKQQRATLAKGNLTAQRVELLSGLGFCWDLEQARWEEQFADFLQFKQQHGHGNIPEVWPENPALAFWAKEQRKERGRGKLAVERQVLLDELGFCWDLEAAYWEEQLEALTRFQAEQGHCLVPPSWPDNPLLADWVSKQRRDWRAGRLAAERIVRLDDLGFVWDPEEREWQQQWAALAEFQASHGHCHVTEAMPELLEWIRQQRRSGMAQTLSPERRNSLDGLGFIWDSREAEWDAMVWAVKQFRAERNHCIIPAQFPENPALARWVATVRRAYANGALSPEQVQRLNGLGFIWDAKAVFWEEMFAAMAEFRHRYGNCIVPETYPENNQLAWWVVAQRKAYKAGQLEPERIERMDALGFFWDPLEAQWYEMYLALLHYREQFGRCVITRGTGDPRLSAWTTTQRQARLHGHLSQVRIDRLDAIGFIWDQKEVVLEEMLAELAAFKESHGHCNVPVPWANNPALGLWVQFQRQEYKKGRLDPQRIQRLEALGFMWS